MWTSPGHVADLIYAHIYSPLVTIYKVMQLTSLNIRPTPHALGTPMILFLSFEMVTSNKGKVFLKERWCWTGGSVRSGCRLIGASRP